MLADLAGALRTAAPADFWLWVGGGCAYLLWAARTAFVALTYRRLIQDTPTTRLRAAAQGFVEVSGTARLFEGEPVLAPLTNRPCCWYRYRVDHRVDDEWRKVDGSTSEEIFMLDDGDGRCAIDPDGATVTPSVSHVWYGATSYPSQPPRPPGLAVWFARGKYRYREERIDIGCELYAVGYLRTHGGAGPGLAQADAAQILREWKADRTSLLARYDTDGNGEIDLQEWERARVDAQASANAAMGGTGVPPAVDVLSRSPQRGQPFLLAAGSQERLVSSQHRRGLFAGGSALAVAVALLWALNLRF